MFGVKLFVCIAFLVVLTRAQPAAVDESDIEFQKQNHELGEEVAIVEALNSEYKVRAKRATCDLLSFGGKVNHSACAAHCIVKGFRGGWCNSRAVCNCRR